MEILRSNHNNKNINRKRICEITNNATHPPYKRMRMSLIDLSNNNDDKKQECEADINDCDKEEAD